MQSGSHRRVIVLLCSCDGHASVTGMLLWICECGENAIIMESGCHRHVAYIDCHSWLWLRMRNLWKAVVTAMLPTSIVTAGCG